MQTLYQSIKSLFKNRITIYNIKNMARSDLKIQIIWWKQKPRRIIDNLTLKNNIYIKTGEKTGGL